VAGGEGLVLEGRVEVPGGARLAAEAVRALHRFGILGAWGHPMDERGGSEPKAGGGEETAPTPTTGTMEEPFGEGKKSCEYGIIIRIIGRRIFQ